jgi:large subunit ribosomal protein L20
MARVKGGTTKTQRRKRILKRAEGYYGARSRLHKVASLAVDKALQYAYRDRKQRKRDFRRLWIIRINAMVRELGLTYSTFMGLLNQKGVGLNRKMLAKMAHEDPEWFKAIVEELRPSNAA